MSTSKARQPEVLHLFLQGHWFDRVYYGDKRIEYREIKPRWTKQIWERRDTLKILILHRGYTSLARMCRITKIDKGECPYGGVWADKEFYRIHFEMETK